MTRTSPRILVCNDDGIHGPGLMPLVAAMRRVGRATVVVPAQERSADSHSLTLHKPIRIHSHGREVFSLNGKPADCARLGTLEILKGKVDLVVSGINRGFNLGEDTVYSGTVAAAREAALLGVPSLAFSQDPEAPSYSAAAAFAAKLAKVVLRQGLPPGVCLNVNFPAVKGRAYKGADFVRLGRRVYSKDVTKREDPRGGRYYWLAGSYVTSLKEEGTDVASVAAGRVSMTPLHVDATHFPTLDSLKKWRL